MSPPVSPFLALACELSAWLLLAALVVTLVRLARGPSLADRVVCLDLVALEIVGLVGVDAVETGQPILLWPALVVALVGFLATIAFAHYLERRNQG